MQPFRWPKSKLHDYFFWGNSLKTDWTPDKQLFLLKQTISIVEPLQINTLRIQPTMVEQPNKLTTLKQKPSIQEVDIRRLSFEYPQSQHLCPNVLVRCIITHSHIFCKIVLMLQEQGMVRPKMLHDFAHWFSHTAQQVQVPERPQNQTNKMHHNK